MVTPDQLLSDVQEGLACIRGRASHPFTALAGAYAEMVIQIHHPCHSPFYRGIHSLISLFILSQACNLNSPSLTNNFTMPLSASMRYL